MVPTDVHYNIADWAIAGNKINEVGEYTPAFLRQHIGKLVRVEFLIGTTYLDDRTGILVEVGASYIVLRSIQDSNLLYCDIYSIKFVTISENPFIYNMDFQV